MGSNVHIWIYFDLVKIKKLYLFIYFFSMKSNYRYNDRDGVTRFKIKK